MRLQGILLKLPNILLFKQVCAYIKHMHISRIKNIVPLRLRAFCDRRYIKRFVDSSAFVNFIITLILINAITLGLETNTQVMDKYGFWLLTVDKFILAIYVCELLLKFYAYGWRFFHSGWNIFDTIIVAIALMPASGALAILRAFRVLRILRLMSVVPSMRKVISAIGHSIPGMTSIIGILLLLFYVSSVIATKLFGVSEDPQIQEWFGSIGASMYTLFQIMTLESWSMGIVRPVMEEFPHAWLFFVPFIFVMSFAVLNLFIGIIVDAMQVIHNRDSEEAKADLRNVADESVNELKAEITSLRQELRDLIKSRSD